jgi:hypothetical protein
VKQGDVLSQLLFKIVLEYAIRKAQTNKDRNRRARHLLVCTGNVNLPDENTNINKTIAEAPLYSSKEICLGVAAEKTQYKHISHHQTTGNYRYGKTTRNVTASEYL